MITSTHEYGPWIQLNSGAPYDFGTQSCPALSFFSDIAYPLARLPRYLHHTSDTWTVGAHATGAARLARVLGMSVRVQYLALHHDDHEALIGDTPSPIKSWLYAKSPEVKAALIELEDSAQEAISQVVIELGGPSVNPKNAMWTDEERKQVGVLDLLMLCGEARILKVKPPRPWGPQNMDERGIEAARMCVRDAFSKDANIGRNAEVAYLKAHDALAQEVKLATV